MKFVLDMDAKTAQFEGITDTFSGKELNIPGKFYIRVLEKQRKVYTRDDLDKDFSYAYTNVTSTIIEKAELSSFEEELPEDSVVGDYCGYTEVGNGSYTALSAPPEKNSNYKQYIIQVDHYVDVEITVDNINLAKEININTINIPETVKSINFNNCVMTSLEKVCVAKGNTVYSSTDDGVLFNKDKTTLVRYPIGRKASDDYIIPDSVTSISGHAFYGEEKDEVPINKHEYGIIFNKNLKNLGANAFSSVSFTTFDFSKVSPDLFDGSKQYEYDKPFCECEVSTLIYPANATKIQLDLLFRKLTGIKTIKLPKECTNFIKFTECEYGNMLCNIDKSSTLEKILDFNGNNFENDYFKFDGNAFFDKKERNLLRFMPGSTLVKYEVKDVDRLSACAFSECKNLQNVIFNEGVSCIPYYCFGESGVRSIVLAKSIKTVDHGAFIECKTLEKIEVKSLDTMFGFYSLCINTDDKGVFTELIIPCNFNKSNFTALCMLNICSDEDGEKNKYRFMSDESGKIGEFTYNHDPVFDPEYANADGSKGAVICRSCGKMLTVPEHVCEYAEANCTYPSLCKICGKVKDINAPKEPNNHEWEINAQTGVPECKLCHKHAMAESSAEISTGRKIILTRTTYGLNYAEDMISKRGFTGVAVKKPTPNSPEVLTLENSSEENFTFSLTSSYDIRDYRVTANNKILTGTKKSGGFEYTASLIDPLTLINVECPYDANKSGKFENTTDARFIYQTKWHV